MHSHPPRALVLDLPFPMLTHLFTRQKGPDIHTEREGAHRYAYVRAGMIWNVQREFGSPLVCFRTASASSPHW
jgi:hypothetical protein